MLVLGGRIRAHTPERFPTRAEIIPVLFVVFFALSSGLVLDVYAQTTVVISSNTANDGATTDSATVSYIATFGQAVTNFDIGGITVTGTASGGSPVPSNFAGSGTTYTFDVVTTSAGTVIVLIPAGAATVAGEESEVNTVSNTYTVTIDTGTNGGSGGNIAQSRPHFGLSPLTDTQLVSCGFSMDGECRDVMDYHVPYNRTVIQTGTTHDFTLKPFNNYNLMMLQLGLGVENVGDPINTAEALITVELTPDYKSDIGYTIESVMTRNNLENVIDEVTESNVSLSTEQCMADLEKDCLVVHINDVMVRDVFYSEPFVINVVDTKRLSSTNYLNEGITVTGESLNPAPEYNLTTGKKVQQEVERLNLVRTDKINDIWTDNNGNQWTKNNHDTWIQVSFTPYVEPQDPAMSVLTRINNNFDDVILQERERAILVWDGTMIQGEIKPSFSYTFDETFDRVDDPKILKQMHIESERALEILRAANYYSLDE